MNLFITHYFIKSAWIARSSFKTEKKCFKTTSNLKLKRRFDFQLRHRCCSLCFSFATNNLTSFLGHMMHEKCHSINKYASFQHNRQRMLNNWLTTEDTMFVHRKININNFAVRFSINALLLFFFSNWYLETVYSLFDLIWLNGTKFSVSNFSCTFQNGNNTKSRRKR